MDLVPGTAEKQNEIHTIEQQKADGKPFRSFEGEKKFSCKWLILWSPFILIGAYQSCDDTVTYIHKAFPISTTALTAPIVQMMQAMLKDTVSVLLAPSLRPSLCPSILPPFLPSLYVMYA